VALALVSSLKDTPVPEGVVAFGEIGLAGEIRSVSQAEARISEAARLGVTPAHLPQTPPLLHRRAGELRQVFRELVQFIFAFYFQRHR